jgi:hypothetical protein
MEDVMNLVNKGASVMTVYPDIFAALAAPFDSKEVKYLPKGGRQGQRAFIGDPGNL